MILATEAVIRLLVTLRKLTVEVYEAKSQVGSDKRGQEGRNFPQFAIDINSFEIHFGCAFSISDSIRAMFWT